MKNFILFLMICFICINSISAQIFVDVSGDDNNSGTIDSPYATITKAISMQQPGDTVFIRGGTYELTATITIGSSQNGSEGNMYYLFSYKNEAPLLDFSAMSLGPKGISMKANYWHIKGLAITGAGDNGMQISGGSFNIIENCSFFENRDTGLQLSKGASYNKIINCDSYYNADPPDYGDADGFAPKLDVGDGNYFYGCRSWQNCDDGWDGYIRGATDITTTLENCWTWGNGYFKDGTDPGSQANGNGFKMGGGDNSNSLELMHHNILINCVAFSNKNKGFDQNNNLGSMTLYNCSSFNNGAANYRIKRELVDGQSLIVKNSLSYNGSVELGSFAIQETNSWLNPFSVDESDFVSLDTSSAYSSRKADFSLPDIDFLHLAETSDLIDAGVNLGYAFNGSAPDLGAFEYGSITALETIKETLSEFILSQNYPNPFNPSTTIEYSIPQNAGENYSSSSITVKLVVYDILGRVIATPVDENQQPGAYRVMLDGTKLSSGLYFYQLTAGDFNLVKRMLLIK